MVRRAALHYIRRLLALEDTPERIALAFAVGIFLAFSPLLGLHTFLGLTIAFLFGLNRVALLIGVFVNNPWTLVPIYAAGAYVGGLLVGYPAAIPWSDFGWAELWDAGFWKALVQECDLLMSFVLGSTVLSVLFAIISYPLALHLLKHARAYRPPQKPGPRT